MRAKRAGCVWAILVAGLAISPVAARDLTFEDRVRHQRAIEEVYWRHRLWPAENAAPKPTLAEVMPETALRAKVETYLKESAALETIWRRPITHEQLQAEIERMTRDTRDERMLTELFQALGNDADIIAETLARQTLADRLIREWYAHDTRFHGAVRQRAEAARATIDSPEDLTSAGGDYLKTAYPRNGDGPSLRWDDARDRIAGRFPDRSVRPGRISPVEETWDAFTITAVLSDRDDAVEVATVTWPKVAFDAWWSGQRSSLAVDLDAPSGTYTIASPLSAECVADSWTPTYFGAPDGRSLHTAVWTGSEMIVWGGLGVGVGPTSTGGRYSPATDTWTPTPTGPGVPVPRSSHTAIWTGTTMVVWGGDAALTPPSVPLASGGRYRPSTDTWLPVSTSGAPSARSLHTATWTGSLMVVWGGSPVVNTGGRYNPSNDTWSATSTGTGVPAARQEHTAVLAFPDIIVWGGRDVGGNALNTGAKYSPASDTWTPATTTGAASARWGHAAVWNGTLMIVWGGRSNVGPLNTGGRYQASTDSWTATSLGSGLPTPRYDHSYVWTLGKLIIWGGIGAGVTNTGAVYDPPSDSWTQTSVGANVPSARQGASAVWTGNEMIVWGGLAATPLNTGGRYNPTSNSWVATSTGSYVPSARALHATVWTGTEMIVWGGVGGIYENTGGRYNAATDVWTPTSLGAGVPTARGLPTAVWTGTRMIVWGGYTTGSTALNTGGRYDPSTDSWTATAIAAPASARYFHTAVWTGNVMIVWGGQDSLSTPLDTGARYDPTTDGWAATTTSSAPSPRLGHTAIWSGSEMIVWGGGDYGAGNLGLNTGGRYNPATNAWTPTSTVGSVPSARFYHVAVWTGSEMIVWGGSGVVTGGRYTPASDTWVPTPTGAGVPAGRALAEAVWTGTEMIVWGGEGPVATGGRYSPAAATWTATSNGTNLPSPRYYHTAVWTGSAMIVWGGADPFTSTGARYCATTCASPGTYYLDADLDGYGVAGSSVVACSKPTGYSALSTDCNDADPNVNPGAFDPCNGTDRNCDGVGDTVPPGEIDFGPISNLGGGFWRYAWPAVPGLRYDAFRGVYKGAIGTDPFEEYCLYNNSYATTWDENSRPQAGALWWYLVRGVNGCGDGTLGFQTVHGTPTTERISLVCP